MLPKDLPTFTSLGTFVLDDVHLPSGEIVKDVPGGSGLYACLGARLFSPGQLSAAVGYTMRKGHDFPPNVLQRLRTWGMSLSIKQEDGLPSTRGELRYHDDTLATKSFRYLTPVLPILPYHLANTDLLHSRSFHFFLDPTQIIEQTNYLHSLRRIAGNMTKPTFIWEPRALSCIPENAQAFIDASRMVDIFSPNHLELASILGKDLPAVPDGRVLEDLCDSLFAGNGGYTSGCTIVVRAGSAGCFVKNMTTRMWLPPYYSAPKDWETQKGSKVVDTTGAGNTFLGAFAIGLLQDQGNIVAASYFGTVGASFAVEQIGVPSLTPPNDGKELWNGEEPQARLQAYREKFGLPS